MQMYSLRLLSPELYLILLVENNKYYTDRDPLKVPYMFIAYLKNKNGSFCSTESWLRHSEYPLASVLIQFL